MAANSHHEWCKKGSATHAKKVSAAKVHDEIRIDAESESRRVTTYQMLARTAVAAPETTKTRARLPLPTRERNRLSPTVRMSVYDAASNIA